MGAGQWEKLERCGLSWKPLEESAEKIRTGQWEDVRKIRGVNRRTLRSEKVTTKPVVA